MRFTDPWGNRSPPLYKRYDPPMMLPTEKLYVEVCIYSIPMFCMRWYSTTDSSFTGPRSLSSIASQPERNHRHQDFVAAVLWPQITTSTFRIGRYGRRFRPSSALCASDRPGPARLRPEMVGQRSDELLRYPDATAFRALFPIGP